MKRLRVYLSSTFEDLKEHRAAVFAALERAGLDVARMEAYAAADERPLDLCLRDVARSEIYVGLVAWRYGYVPPDEHGNPQGKSITALEYRQAEDRTLRKLLFFAHSDTKAHWPDRFKDEVTGDGERGAKLDAFRNELGTEKTVSFFRTPDELATLVLAAIMRSGLSGRPYNVPPRPMGFVPRPSLTQALIESLIGADAGGTAAASTLVQGAGGFGKTTLAIDACHQPEMVNAFPEGMLWVALGEKPDLLMKLSDLYASVTGSAPAVAGIDAIEDALRKVLEQRRCLLVVDDVWRVEDLAPFLRLVGPRILVTTRIRTLIEQAGQIGWLEVPVDEMEVGEAAALLGRGLSLDDSTRDALRGLADRLGCWPLLLDLANARLAEEQKSRRGNLAECIDRVMTLFERRGVLGFDRRNSDARNAAVASSVAVGLELAEAMFPGLAEKAAEISVFPEDVPVPVRVLADLWSLDVFDAEDEVARPLQNLSILRWDRQTNEVRVHDMVQRVLAARLAEPAVAHRKLIDAWGDPYRLPHDYAWRWFGWHCVRANEQARLHGLLLDFDWLRAKLAATEIDTLVGEFDHARDDQLAELLKSNCRRSAHVLAGDKSQLAGQLLARIPENEKRLRDRILERALAVRGAWLRPLTPSLAAERSIRWFRPAAAETLNSVVFSPNGLWVAYVSGGFGGSPRDVIIWNLEEWQSHGPRFQTLARLNPFSLALSDDARWCLYADSIGGVHRLGTLGDEVWTGHAHRNLTIAKLLAISADGRRALSSCQQGRLVAWDIDAGHHEVVWDESDNHTEALCLDAVGNSAVTARTDGSVDLLDLWPTSQRHLFKLSGRPAALARSSDNSVVAAATTDGRIEVRSVDSPEPPIGIFETKEQPTSIAMSSDHRYIAVGTARGTVEVWNVTRAARSARYDRAQTYEVERIAFSHDGARVVSADRVQVKEWALDVSSEEDQGFGSRAAGQVKVTADGLHAVAVLEDGRLGVWNIRTGALESGLPRASGPAFGDPGFGPSEKIALAAKAPRILSWNEKLLCVWDLEAAASVGSLSIANARAAAITPDGTGVVYLNGPNITLWRPDEGKCSVLGTYHGDLPGYLAISPDGQRAVSSGGARQVFVWRLNEPSATELSPYQRVCHRRRELGMPSFGNEAELASCRIDSSDKPATVEFAGPSDAIVTTGDGSLFVFDTNDQKISKARKFAGRHEAFVSRVLVTSDGKLAVTSSYDRKIMVWDLDRRECLSVLDSDTVFIEQLSMSAQRVLLTTVDGVLQIVSLHDGALLCAFEGDKLIVTCAADAELQWVVARDKSGEMHFFHVEGGT